MAGRIRTIKPEILENKRTAALDSDAFRLFIGCIALADDYGNLCAEPMRLQGAVFWSWNPRETVANLLGTLASARLLAIYRVDGQQFAHIIGWTEHQRVDKPGKPKVPKPEAADPVGEQAVTEDSRGTRETVATESREPRETPNPEWKGGEGRGEEEETREKMPFTISEAVSALKTEAGDRIVTDPFPQKQVKNLTALIRRFPVLSDWALIGSWLGAGGEWRADLGVGELVSSFEKWLGLARQWDAKGRRPPKGGSAMNTESVKKIGRLF